LIGFESHAFLVWDVWWVGPSENDAGFLFSLLFSFDLHAKKLSKNCFLETLLTWNTKELFDLIQDERKEMVRFTKGHHMDVWIIPGYYDNIKAFLNSLKEMEEAMADDDSFDGEEDGEDEEEEDEGEGMEGPDWRIFTWCSCNIL
jgi:hypothetical protein